MNTRAVSVKILSVLELGLPFSSSKSWQLIIPASISLFYLNSAALFPFSTILCRHQPRTTCQPIKDNLPTPWRSHPILDHLDQFGCTTFFETSSHNPPPLWKFPHSLGEPPGLPARAAECYQCQLCSSDNLYLHPQILAACLAHSQCSKGFLCETM